MMKTIKIKDESEIPLNYTGIAEWGCGSRRWYLNGDFHRIYGPAIESVDGYKFWFLNGVEITEEEHTRRLKYMNTTLGKLLWQKHT